MNFGIIGPGHIADRFATVLKDASGCQLEAVASRNQDRAAAFAQKHGASKAYDSTTKLLEDPAVDAVYIALPHNAHKNAALAAIAHGKAVLCEKPLSTNAADAREMIDQARQHQVLLMEAMWTRTLPAYRQVLQWVRDGRIGELKLIQASFSFQMPYNPKFRHYNPDTAGGSLLDAGVYPVEFAIGCAGCKPDAVSGLITRAPSGVDNLASFSLSFPNDILASLSCGFSVKSPGDAWLLGTEGRILVSDFIRTRHCELQDADGSMIDQFDSEDVDGFIYEIEHFKALFESGAVESPLIPWHDTIASAEVIDRILAQNA